MAQYQIIDENGDVYASAHIVRHCALLQKITPRQQAMKDVATLNAEAGRKAFRAERVRS